MNALDSIMLIAGYASSFVAFAAALCIGTNTTKKDEEPAENLRFNGVLYVGDRKFDVYRHTGTNASYYKSGLMYRSAINGQLVSVANAEKGLY